MSKYEIIDIPEFTEEQTKRLDELQAKSDGKTTLDDRTELLTLQWLESAHIAKKKWNNEKAVSCYERYKKLV